MSATQHNLESIPHAYALIYRALLYSIESNTGNGFQNNDQGHPAYREGAIGLENYSLFGDDSSNNRLYQVMRFLSQNLRECPDFLANEHVDNWQDFCRLVTSSSKESL